MEENTNTNEYKLVIDLLKEARDNYQTLRKTIITALKTKYDIIGNPLETVIKFSKEEISQLTDEEVLNYMSRYTDKFSIDNADEARVTMIEILDSAIVIFGSKKKVEELENEANSIITEYANYASSDKIVEKKKSQIEDFTKSLEMLDDTEENAAERKKIKNMIDTMTECIDFSFITKRLEKGSKKEVLSIVDGFFTSNRSSIILNQYSSKIVKFKFSEKLYKYFFNLEENFLPEEYHPFNNLFLFIYMRYVRYADPYDKNDVARVQAITSAMANLVYHKFADNANEIAFIEVMKKTLDYFKDYRDRFVNNNITWSKHPVRIKAAQDNEKIRKDGLISKMKDLNIEGYDPESTADELQRYFNVKLDEIIAKREEEAKQNLISSKSNSDDEDEEDYDEVDEEEDYDKVDEEDVCDDVNENEEETDSEDDTEITSESPVNSDISTNDSEVTSDENSTENNTDNSFVIKPHYRNTDVGEK